MIELRLTEEQANIVSSACEFYARIQMGQFQEIGYTCPKMPGALGYDEVTAAWLALRKCIYPELKQKMSFSCKSPEVGSPERLWLLYKHQGSDSFHFLVCRH